jgi:hypothetical protein
VNGQTGSRAFPIEDFVQSLTAQLDRAQDALALKVRTGRPLTFAIKDLSIDLQVFWEADRAGRVLVRHAGPNEEGASTVHLAFTTITRSMVEENTISLALDEDPRRLDELAGKQFNDEDRHRLEMVGVRTVGQLKRLSQGTDPKSVETFAGIPVMRLRAALEQAARPNLTGVEAVARGDRKLLKIRGVNLSADQPPEVMLSGEPVEVLEASDQELLVRPMSHHQEGQVEVRIGTASALGFYELPGAATRGTGGNGGHGEPPGTAPRLAGNGAHGESTGAVDASGNGAER